MNKKEELIIVAVILGAAALFCFIGYNVGYSRAEAAVRQEAVDNHAATWECDQKDGSRHLKWHNKEHNKEHKHE